MLETALDWMLDGNRYRSNVTFRVGPPRMGYLGENLFQKRINLLKAIKEIRGMDPITFTGVKYIRRLEPAEKRAVIRKMIQEYRKSQGKGLKQGFIAELQRALNERK
jgi:hypothetical protein